MRNWLIRFMTGRYGGDQLNRLVSFVSIAFAVLAIIFSFAMSDSPVGSVLWVIALAFLAIVYYRAFSKDFKSRRAYSIPVRLLPNPRWVHCKSTPPRVGFRSTMATLAQPAPQAAVAAAIPAAPPPMTSKS